MYCINHFVWGKIYMNRKHFKRRYSNCVNTVMPPHGVIIKGLQFNSCYQLHYWHSLRFRDKSYSLFKFLQRKFLPVKMVNTEDAKEKYDFQLIWHQCPRIPRNCKLWSNVLCRIFFLKPWIRIQYGENTRFSIFGPYQLYYMKWNMMEEVGLGVRRPDLWF